MMRPKLRRLHSPDVQEPTLPADPGHCVVLIQAMVGPDDGPGEESFDFCVVTPSYLQEQHVPRWGRGLLIVESFDWTVVRNAVEKRIADVSGDTWQQIGSELNKEFVWEFDTYRYPITGAPE
jgi:hypothetical protein